MPLAARSDVGSRRPALGATAARAAPRPALPPGMAPSRLAGQRQVLRSRSDASVTTTPVPAGQLRTIGEGRPIEPQIRQAAERFFQADFSAVRVHVGPAAPALGALAFTLGEQLHFAPGLYDPTTREGVELLGHELTHVVQQRDGRVENPYGQGVAIVQNPALEQEADRLGQQLAEAIWSGSRAGQPAMPAARASARAIANPGLPAAGEAGPAAQPALETWGYRALYTGLAIGGAYTAGRLYNWWRGRGGGDGGDAWGELARRRPMNRIDDTEESWADLFDDPPRFLGTRELLIPHRFSPDVNATRRGTARIPTVNVYLCTEETRRELWLRRDLSGYAAQTERLARDPELGIFIPWGQNEAHRVTLNRHVTVYLTDQLNGCGILISGPRIGPTVIHANYYIGHDDAPVWRYVYSRQTTHEYNNQQREDAYRALATHLGLPRDYYLYSPVGYYQHSNRARVFGLRDYDGWKFFATDGPTGNKTTHQIWPPPEL